MLDQAHPAVDQTAYMDAWKKYHKTACTRVSQIKTLNVFYLLIYWTQNVHNDFIFVCSIVLPPVGHSSNHEYHCWNLKDNRTVFRNFIALLRFSFDSPSYKSSWGWTLGCSKNVEDTIIKLKQRKKCAYCWFLLHSYVTMHSSKNMKFTVQLLVYTVYGDLPHCTKHG